MSTCRPTSTPLIPNSKLLKSTIPEDQIDVAFRQKYQSLVGSLQYATLGTRPDLSYAACMYLDT
ncbi:hypothetical protein M407DRAFT_30633 [Tulasnella calospora MUT 4182]|uniref:Uncharacterized protein n=1 Tax=Tulasnella calospora MUT 4182 TaxID=1051891 RepID=A0A0C3PXA7_9AGAM|nr:hypothetical protein M407DRAFT_30633 [Tulasnella calospora MUT 4182]